MLDSYVVIGMVIAIVGIAKTFTYFNTKRGKLLVPLIVFTVAGAVNTANCIVFGDSSTWKVALKVGLEYGAVAGGIYGMGKMYMEKKKGEDVKE